MKIWIRNLQKQSPLNSGKIRKAAQTILAELGSPDGELSIVFVDDPRIRELNRRYLHRDKPTNVLAFSMAEGEFPTLHPHLLGDLVISVETAERQSNRFGLSAGEMVILLMIHGILHLLGYDHLGSKKKAREMAAKQMELLRLVLQREN
ncbi:MAG: rRNA maturation RNase YbeY [Deltaproteobacteria bacterium RBG_13_52_11b]|nr:MAG: rRNA maturation RNase YbeY [Deltaproteobacteria bacterium RBG_13_52_11b]